jgi:hypothetical protein
MTDLNEQNDFSDILTDSDSDDYLIFEDLETTPLVNLADFADDTSENYLFDMESGGINPEDTTGASTDELSGASNTDLTVGYSSYSYVIDVWGTPNSDLDYWRYQDGENACAVVAQVSVYESITGEFISEATAAEIAEYWGWYDPYKGTFQEDSDNLLNYWGIETVQDYDGTIETIANALNNGDKVLVSLDGNEIWTPEYYSTGVPAEQIDAGHAVWVTGIQLNADNTVDFVLNDSGNRYYGQGDLVDYYDFMNAWDDTNYHFIIADA